MENYEDTANQEQCTAKYKNETHRTQTVSEADEIRSARSTRYAQESNQNQIETNSTGERREADRGTNGQSTSVKDQTRQHLFKY